MVCVCVCVCMYVRVPGTFGCLLFSLVILLSLFGDCDVADLMFFFQIQFVQFQFQLDMGGPQSTTT